MWCGGTNQIKSVQPTGEHTLLDFHQIYNARIFQVSWKTYSFIKVYFSFIIHEIICILIFLPQIYETLVTNYLYTICCGRYLDEFAFESDDTLLSHRPSGDKTSVGCSSLVFTRRKYLVSAGRMADFYIDSSPSWPYLVVPRLSPDGDLPTDALSERADPDGFSGT